MSSTWDATDIPPRLTPSPPFSAEPVSDAARKPTPPPRKSIYQSSDTKKWHINVQSYDPAWPSQFRTIQNRLHNLFTTSSPSAPYLTIEHVGSTCLPGMSAKPNIDVLCTFATSTDYHHALAALHWEIPTTPPFAKYTQIPRGGGIRGRESFKIYLPPHNSYVHSTPEQNIYLVLDTPENRAGQILVRSYRTLREILLDPAHVDLFERYRDVKLELAGRSWDDGLEYARQKDGVIRAILRRGRWTDEEVDEKEKLVEWELKEGEEEEVY